jgi:hypothetical protein
MPNMMQLNAGLGAGSGHAGIQTPAMTASMLMEQANANRMALQQTMNHGSSLGVFSQQYQQQLAATQQNYMNPYMAQALTGAMPSGHGGAPGFQAGMMPSPITMTPAHTGVFRQQAAAPNYATIPHMRPMPILSGISPFEVTRPDPLFTTPRDQRLMEQDVDRARYFSLAASLPSIGAEATGYMGGALAGAAFGGHFGAAGAAIGGIGGAALAGMSGMPGAMGSMANRMMRPVVQRREMGAAIQRSSSDWVVSGSDLHARGHGLSRDASINLAGELQNLVANRSFQKETDGRFTSHDMMQIMQQGGQAGIFDMDQSVSQIKERLRETSRTVKSFMELTQDPDVVSVVQQLGRLHQMGMGQQEMVQAARNMKMYAHMAGTTIQGVQQIGGLPGAMTFNQVGLSAGTGFNYGNFAAGSARQWVASGAMSPRELSLMGGVQGITQREIQSQAAMASMPIFGASHMQFQGGRWGLNQGQVGATGGAQGMVHSALDAARGAVQAGGISALGTMGMMQRDVADQAMRDMSPEQAMLHRFGMVNQTMNQLGLSGSEGFGTTAQAMFGQDVGEQMYRQARDPRFWQSQSDAVKRRREIIAEEQAIERRQNRGRVGRFLDTVGMSGVGDDFQDLYDTYSPIQAITGGISDGWAETGGRVTGALGRAGGAIRSVVSNAFLDDDVIRRTVPSGSAMMSEAHREGAIRRVQARTEGRDHRSMGVGIDQSMFNAAREGSWLGPSNLARLGRSLNFQQGMEGAYGMSAAAGGALAGPLTTLKTLGLVSGRDVTEGAQGLVSLFGQDSYGDARDIIHKADVERRGTLNILRGSSNITGDDENAAYSILDRITEGHAGEVLAGMDKGGEGLTKGRGRYTPVTRKELIDQLVETSGGTLTRSAVEGLDSSEQDKLLKVFAGRAATDSKVQRRFERTEKEYAKDLASSQDDAAELTGEVYDEAQADLEHSLNIQTSTIAPFSWGIGNIGTLGAEGFRDSMKGQTIDETMLMAAVAGGGGRGSEHYRESFKLWKKSNPQGTDQEFYQEWEAAKKKYEGLDRRTKRRYEGLTKTGRLHGEGTVAERLGQVVQLATLEDERTMGEAIRGYASEFSDYADSDKLTDLTNRVGTLRGKDLADTITEEGLQKMVGEGKGDLAERIRGAQRGRQEDIDWIEQNAAEVAGIGTKKDEQAIAPKGKEAKDLKDAEALIKNMAAAFSGFETASSDFKDGAKNLKDAMETSSFAGRVTPKAPEPIIPFNPYSVLKNILT